MMADTIGALHIRIVVPDISFQTLMVFHPDDTVWAAKQKLLKTAALKDLQDGMNYGLYSLPTNGKAGKFLDEERSMKEYPLPGPIGVLEFKYKKRVYKTSPPDAVKMRKLHSQTNLRAFIDHVRKGDVEKIGALTNKGLDPNFIDRVSGETPLTLSATLARPRSVMLVLVSGGAILDFRNGHSQTAMHVAVRVGNRDALATLLDLGASPNYKDARELTPLFYCVTRDSQAGPQCVQMLLYNRADIGAEDEQQNTELHQACLNGRVQHVEHLVFYGADMNAVNSAGDTPLHVCARMNQEECARVLLFRGADKSVRNKSSQDAAQLAHLSGNGSLEAVIRNFRPQDVVLFQELPTYNEKRRGTISAATLRNLQRSRSNPQLNLLFDSHPGLAGGGSSSLSSAFQYRSNGFLADHHRPEAGRPGLHRETEVGEQGLSHTSFIERNDYMPRTVVVHKDHNGFGFILRGAKSRPGCPSALEFTPAPDFPSLQYFDIIEKNSMAEKAGLRCGDFLLEVCGQSVVNATHEYAVHLIKNAGDILVLKVVEGKSPAVSEKMPVQSNITTASQPARPVYGSTSSGLSSRVGTTSSRATLDGLEELERLDATLDNYDKDGMKNQQRLPPATKMTTSFNHAEPTPVANRYNSTTYITKVELHSVPPSGHSETMLTDNSSKNQSYSHFDNTGKVSDKWIIHEPAPDYDAEEDTDCISQPLTLPRPQPIINPPVPPPLPLSLKNDSSPSVRIPPQTTQPVDDSLKQRNEAHAALMAAVLQRRQRLENVNGEEIADTIEMKVQRTKALQTIYRADQSVPEISKSSTAVKSSEDTGLVSKGMSSNTPNASSAVENMTNFSAEAEKARLEFVRKANASTLSLQRTTQAGASGSAREPPVKPARTLPNRPQTHQAPPVQNRDKGLQNGVVDAKVAGVSSVQKGPGQVKIVAGSHTTNLVDYSLPSSNNASSTKMNSEHTKLNPKFLIANNVQDSTTDNAKTGSAGDGGHLKIVTDDAMSVLSLSTLSTNSSVGIDGAQSSHGSPSHSSSSDSGYTKSMSVSPRETVDQPIIPPPVEFASDGYPFVMDNAAVSSAANNLRSVAKNQSNSMVFPARARVTQK